MQVWQGYIMASIIYQWMFMANISFFHKFENLAAILNILAYFSQTQPEMHVYLNFHVRTHHKDSKNLMSLMIIPSGTLLHLKPVYKPDIK